MLVVEIGRRRTGIDRCRVGKERELVAGVDLARYSQCNWRRTAQRVGAERLATRVKVHVDRRHCAATSVASRLLDLRQQRDKMLRQFGVRALQVDVHGAPVARQALRQRLVDAEEAVERAHAPQRISLVVLDTPRAPFDFGDRHIVDRLELAKFRINGVLLLK